LTIIYTLLLLALISSIVFYASKRKIRSAVKQPHQSAASLPVYYGWCAVAWCLLAGVAAFVLSSAVSKYLPLPAHNTLLITAAISVMVAALSLLWLSPRFKARQHLEKIGNLILIISALVSISITLLIIASVLFESIRFFKLVPLHDFLLGLNWSPQTALRADQAGSSGSFGAVPIFVGTLLITCIAMVVAIPLGLLAAIYLSEYATQRVRTIIKPTLEMLAGIPTVVYGYFAALTVAPYIRASGAMLGLDVASESALAAGLVMGIMIIPFILSLSDDVMNAVPNNLREASLALGATRAETVTKVVLPAALPGIMGAVLLAISRAIGETMIVTMAAGLSANLTFNPFSSVTTVTAQIVTLLVGDQEFDSAKTLAAFALGFVLFIITLMLNILALTIVKRYRQRYE
jgi:phosphate transport system permease protein